jgi:hypothetical protein
MLNIPVKMNLLTTVSSADSKSFRVKSLSCLLLIALFAAPAVRAQTADEVVAKYVAALGGKEKVQSIQSVYQEGTAVMQNGMEIE